MKRQKLSGEQLLTKQNNKMNKDRAYNTDGESPTRIRDYQVESSVPYHRMSQSSEGYTYHRAHSEGEEERTERGGYDLSDGEGVSSRGLKA